MCKIKSFFFYFQSFMDTFVGDTSNSTSNKVKPTLLKSPTLPFKQLNKKMPPLTVEKSKCMLAKLVIVTVLKSRYSKLLMMIIQ